MEEKTKDRIKDELEKAKEKIKHIIDEEDPGTEVVSTIILEKKKMSLSFSVS